jgi:hypothetical protein
MKITYICKAVLYSQFGCRSLNFIAYYERLTGTMVGFEKVGKWRVPFAVQCKYTKCTIQPCLKYYLLAARQMLDGR